ncbi:hypothetical protein [Sphingobacterium multivorum]|uniref:hypothetical protein n=1 Tax=Sphingobacterium multivorum TaxID=28454 RepID=UPI00289AC5AD|nr:hypothetical protein [Sphingobacterium multivorum]
MALPFAIITDEGVVLDVSPDSKLTVEFVATTFNEETVLKGSYTYPVTFPPTEKNDMALGYGRFLENRLGRKSIDVNISLLGMSWKRAKLEYDISARSKYEGYLTIDNSIVADLMRDKTIAEVFTTTINSKFVSHKSIRIDGPGAGINDKIVAINSSIGVYPFCMPTYFNPMATGVLKSKSDGSNDVDFEKSVINDFSNGYTINGNSLYGAFFYLTWVIKEVCAFLGFQAEGSYLDDSFIKSLIIDNTGTRTADDILANGMINPAQHLPKLSIADFFKALRNDHRVMIYFDSQTKKAYFEKATKILSEPNRLDISGMQIKDSVSIKRQSISAYKLLTKVDDADEMYKVLPYEGSVIVGYTDSFKEVEMAIGRPFMWAEKLWNIENVRLPRKTQMGNCYGVALTELPAYNADNTYGKNSFAFRLLSYKGSVGFGGPVWIAEATADDIGNLNRTFNNSLALGGEKGVINRFSLAWYAYYCISEQVEISAKFDVIQFMAINPLQKLLIADVNKAKVEALIDKVTFEPTNNSERIDAKVICYPHYDLNAIASGFRVVVNSPETIDPEGKLYAKVLLKINPNGNSYRSYADLILELYQDSQTSIPALSVNNLNVHVDRRIVNFDDQSIREEGSYGDYVVSENVVVLASNVDRYWWRYDGRDALMYYMVSDPSLLHDKFEIMGHWVVQLDGQKVSY